jgi:hypothetical protein
VTNFQLKFLHPFVRSSYLAFLMGDDDDDDGRSSPYSVCGGCSFVTLITLILIFLFISAFGGQSMPTEAGKDHMLGAQWVRIECSPGENHIMTLWEYCKETSTGVRTCYDYSDFGSRTIPGLDDELSDLIVKKFKQSEGFVMLTMISLLVFGALLCLLMNTNQQNCCLLYSGGALIFFSWYAAMRTVTLVFGLAGITNPSTWDASCDNGTMVTGNGALLWFCNCALLLLLFTTFWVPLCCGCGLFAICSASGKGGTQCCAQAPEAGGEAAEEVTSACGKCQVFCHDVVVEKIITKLAVVVEAVYINGKVVTMKLVTVCAPLLCLPCWVLDQAAGGATPTPCIMKIAAVFEVVVIGCVVVGIFCGYPGPFPADEAIGNPWIVATCGPAAYPRYIATLFEFCTVANADTVLCYDYDDHPASTFPRGANLKQTMYTELQPLALCSLFLVVLLSVAIFARRFFGAKSTLCSPLGWILAMATFTVLLGMLTLLSTSLFFTSDAISSTAWSFGCVDTVSVGNGAWLFVIAMAASVTLSLLLLWPILLKIRKCFACCCCCCNKHLYIKKKEEKEEPASEELEEGKVVV